MFPSAVSFGLLICQIPGNLGYTKVCIPFKELRCSKNGNKANAFVQFVQSLNTPLHHSLDFLKSSFSWSFVVVRGLRG